MKRLFYNELKNWMVSARRKPLIVRGARQVGKTFLIKEFGTNEFKNFIIIDFERNPEFKKIFSDNHNPTDIIREIEILKDTRISTGETLLFLDELQECPDAILSMRYFHEEMLKLHVIGAGSLLEFAFGSVSIPVGRIQMMQMYPLNFYEFLLATGNSRLADLLTEGPAELSESIHEKFLKLLRTYFITGGMPESVKVYIETSSLKASTEVLSELVNTYRFDFSKYTPSVDKTCLDNVFSSCATGVGSQTKYSGLTNGFSNPTIKKAYHSLALAKVIIQVKSVNPPVIPFETSASDKIFKTLILDIGIMNYLSGMPVLKEYLKEDISALYRGALAEQFAGQELMASTGHLYYWARNEKSSTAEVDYIIQKDGKVIPVEVKSADKGKFVSLGMFMDAYKSKEGYVLSTRKYAVSSRGKIKFIPLYYAGHLIHKK
ncbi:MAG: ATP-binding protein [Bacteroidia bacterium]|nr:ATP-binding protein [Bacteroidia bacterium]